MPAPTTATSTRVSFSSLGYSGSFVPVHHTGSFFGLRAAAMLDLVVEPEVLQHHFALLPGVVPKEIRAFENDRVESVRAAVADREDLLGEWGRIRRDVGAGAGELQDPFSRLPSLLDLAQCAQLRDDDSRTIGGGAGLGLFDIDGQSGRELADDADVFLRDEDPADLALLLFQEMPTGRHQE